MADKDKEKDTKPAEKEEASQKPETKSGVLTWIIMVSVIVVLSGSGFVVGRLVAGSEPTAEQAAGQEEDDSKQADADTKKTSKPTPGTWYYNELEPVVVNPDEPGATRFVRVGLILEINNELDQVEAKTMLENKKPLLINWLNLYFKSLSLDQMENERDMNRILSQIKDGFNEILFPAAKPQIKNVLIREFNIQ